MGDGEEQEEAGAAKWRASRRGEQVKFKGQCKGIAGRALARSVVARRLRRKRQKARQAVSQATLKSCRARRCLSRAPSDLHSCQHLGCLGPHDPPETLRSLHTGITRLEGLRGRPLWTKPEPATAAALASTPPPPGGGARARLQAAAAASHPGILASQNVLAACMPVRNR